MVHIVIILNALSDADWKFFVDYFSLYYKEHNSRTSYELLLCGCRDKGTQLNANICLCYNFSKSGYHISTPPVDLADSKEALFSFFFFLIFQSPNLI